MNGIVSVTHNKAADLQLIYRRMNIVPTTTYIYEHYGAMAIINILYIFFQNIISCVIQVVIITLSMDISLPRFCLEFTKYIRVVQTSSSKSTKCSEDGKPLLFIKRYA